MNAPFLTRLLGSAILALAAPCHAQLVRQPNSTLALPATLPNATGYTTENALGTLTFAAPIDIAVPPGVTDRLFVVERNSGVQMVNLTTLQKTQFLNLATFLNGLGTPLSTSGESGFLSMAFHPNYNQNGHIFVFYSLRITGSSGQPHQRVARFTANGTPGNYNAATSVNTATHLPLITQRDEASNHNGGDLVFGNDGLLYISVGDEGPQGDGADNARRIAKDFFGAILRLDVDQPPRPDSLLPNPHDESSTATVGDSAINPGSYRIPADNPFIGFTSYNGFTFPATQVRTEIYSIGYRNPWRITFDAPTGRLFVADVGQNTWEEIDIVTRGMNAGWSWREGLHPHTPAQPPAAEPPGFNPTPPIYEYSHGSGTFQGLSVTGGIIYRGTRLTERTGDYIFTDYVSGRLWALKENAGTWAVSFLFDEADNQIGAIGTDPRNGDVLFCFTGSNPGQIKRLVRTFTGGTPPPALLSQTGAFSSLATLTPNAGIVSYEPNVSFWSDYALKRRWFSIPNIASDMTFSEDGLWSFPAGQVWIKHFDLELERGNDTGPKRRLETRFIVKNAAGSYGITYKWRVDESDADLIGPDGLNETISVNVGGTPTPQVWRYPSRSECTTCHTAAAGHALSFNTRQLNGDHNFGILQNQIAALSGAGYFTAAVPTVNHLPAFSRADDDTKSYEHRVRSYLAVNCIQCHVPGVVPGNWDARPATPTDLAGLINGPLVSSGGDPLNRFVVPGETAYSMLLHRLNGAGVPRMPPLGTNVIDQPAIDLVTAWINDELPARQSFSEWQTAIFGSPGAPDSAPGDDPDDDGETNAFEFLARSNPLVPEGPWALVPQSLGGDFQLTFQQPANRAVLVETSADLQTWSLWDVPRNQPLFNAEMQMRTLSGPMLGTGQFFRARLLEQ